MTTVGGSRMFGCYWRALLLLQVLVVVFLVPQACTNPLQTPGPDNPQVQYENMGWAEIVLLRPWHPSYSNPRSPEYTSLAEELRSMLMRELGGIDVQVMEMRQTDRGNIIVTLTTAFINHDVRGMLEQAEEAINMLPLIDTPNQFQGSNNTMNDTGTSSCSGNKVLYGSSGILELSSAMYTNNKDCSWEILAPEGSVLDIQWLGFQLEEEHNCIYDWVKVVDFYRPDELIYGQKLCGSPGFLNTNSYMTNTNKLTVTFHSDESETANGFKMLFQALQIPHGYHNTIDNIGTSSCSGSKKLHGTTGTLELTSAQYTHNKNCEWKVMAPQGSVLALQWLGFHTEGSHDTVKIVDLHRPTELVYGTSLSGSRGFFNSSSWMLSSNFMKVTFQSDYSVSKDGFKLRFQALQIPNISPYQTGQVVHNDTVPSICSGHKVLEGTWGQLALTNYPNNKDCSWLLKTPPGSVVSLRWLQFDLERDSFCANDWVSVTDLNRPSPLVYGKKLCGTSEFLDDRALTVASNRIHIAFHSDVSLTGTGFLLEYQALQVPLTN